ncbi:hypothetical protein ACFSJ3_16945 [Corallincola platygyrae]|uniref:Wadjet protein JetD C-terminal domain-containing protein n=1 Tax=Corallincola platygyrae TaxID=1193278 RepID=A0ABW4XS52_9GAMM
MSLRTYLQQIDAGKPVNFDRLKSLLPPEYSSEWKSIFGVKKVTSSRWSVEVKDPERFEALLQLAERPKNRLEATEKGDSHLSGTSHSYLLVYHDGLPDVRPGLVLLSDQGVVQDFEPKKRVLLVENEENFFQPQKMLEAAAQLTGQAFSLADTDVVLGSGSRGLSAERVDWYLQYEQVVCAFDYDTAGLEMYASLERQIRRLRERRDDITTLVSYLQPEDYESWWPQFKCQPKSEKNYLRGRKLATELGFDSLALAFAKTRKFMEQEMLLTSVTVQGASKNTCKVNK